METDTTTFGKFIGMKAITFFLFSFVFLLSCFGEETAKPDLVIRNVTVIDGTGAAATPGRDVVVRLSRIFQIGKDVSTPDGTLVIDGSDRYLIPGLWDMHAHLAAMEPVDRNPEIFVSYGITGIRDMGGHLEDLLKVRNEIKAGHRTGPNIWMAGPTLNGSPEADFHRVVKSPQEVPAVITELKNAGIDFIKIHNQTLPEVFYAISRETKKQDLAFAGHVPFGISLTDASNAGMKSIEHIQVLLETIIYQKENPAKGIKDALDRLFGEDGREAFQTFVRNGTAHTPTLIAYEKFISTIENPDQRVQAEALFRKLIELTGLVHKSGVTILAGTDLPSYAGESLHDELELLVRAGLTPMEALQSATLHGAKILGVSEESGTVEIGKWADLVLLDADPLTDIRNTKKISGVILRGRMIGPDEVDLLRKSPKASEMK